MSTSEGSRLHGLLRIGPRNEPHDAVVSAQAFTLSRPDTIPWRSPRRFDSRSPADGKSGILLVGPS
jgi:hypothetical protein